VKINIKLRFTLEPIIIAKFEYVYVLFKIIRNIFRYVASFNKNTNFTYEMINKTSFTYVRFNFWRIISNLKFVNAVYYVS